MSTARSTLCSLRGSSVMLLIPSSLQRVAYVYLCLIFVKGKPRALNDNSDRRMSRWDSTLREQCNCLRSRSRRRFSFWSCTDLCNRVRETLILQLRYLRHTPITLRLPDVWLHCSNALVATPVKLLQYPRCGSESLRFCDMVFLCGVGRVKTPYPKVWPRCNSKNFRFMQTRRSGRGMELVNVPNQLIKWLMLMELPNYDAGFLNGLGGLHCQTLSDRKVEI